VRDKVSYPYYGLHDRGSTFRFPEGSWECFPSPPLPERLGGLHSLRSNGYQGLFPAASGREADHSPPPSAEIKEFVELYLHSPNTPSWYCAKFSTGVTLLYKTASKIIDIYILRAERSGIRFPAGVGIFLFTTASRPSLGPTQPPIQWIQWAISMMVKRQGREADHSPPFSAEVKECVELYLHFSNTPSWRGAQLRIWRL
jgi:hypothetical protein